jgi:hypothetical protein
VLNSVLYVEPLYLAAEAGGGLPQLKRVLVAYSDQVVMELSLDAALSKIFGGTVSSAQPAPAPTPTAQAPGTPSPVAEVQALIRQANQHYERAQQFLRQGDWGGYGEEIKKLGEVLNRLSAQPSPTRK